MIDKTLEAGFDSYNTQKVTCQFCNEEGRNLDSTVSYCGRVKYHYPMLGGLLFPQAVFNSAWDIAQTSEYFGSGAEANKLNIVFKKFKHVVESNQLKGIAFSPVSHTRFSLQ